MLSLCRILANETREGIDTDTSPHTNNGGRFWVIKCCCNRAITLLITDKLWHSLPQGCRHHSVPLDTVSCLGITSNDRLLADLNTSSSDTGTGSKPVLSFETGFSQASYNKIMERAQMNSFTSAWKDFN